MKKFLSFSAAAAAICALPSIAAAQTPVLTTGDGFNIADWVPVVATAIGAVIAAVLAVYFAIMVVRVGMGWLRRTR